MKKYNNMPVRFLAGRLAAFCGVDYHFFSNTEDSECGTEDKCSRKAVYDGSDECSGEAVPDNRSMCREKAGGNSNRECMETNESDAESALNPICVDEAYRKDIMRLADGQTEPLIHSDGHGAVYLCLKESAGYDIFGPIALRAMDRVELHRFYREHGIRTAEDRPFPILSVRKILLLAQMAAGIILSCEFTEEELLKANAKGLGSDADEASVAAGEHAFHFSMQEEERESYHHTYQEERRITQAVEEGRTEDAVRLSMALDDKVGTMGAGYLEQMQKTAISAITVCTRAAIRGGISPAEAYQISDFFIQKLDQCTGAASLTDCRNQAVRMLTERVRKKQEQKKVSSYVDACCDYVGKHYREKIYLDDVAEKMGISPTYLSRLFSKEKGMTLQEYILKTRVERAANLLTYSDSSIAEIGDYVNFPSQSYFGRIFKKYTGLTPKQYRNAHKPREFTV